MKQIFEDGVIGDLVMFTIGAILGIFVTLFILNMQNITI